MMVRGQEVKPLGCVDVFIELVFHEVPLYSLPIDFRGFHRSHTRERIETQKITSVESVCEERERVIVKGAKVTVMR